MRILLCISTLSTGGSERQLTMLAVELQRKGHDVHVVFRVEGRFLGDLRHNGVTCHQIKTGSNYSPLVFSQFFAFVKEIKPEVIHSWLGMMDVLAGFASRLYGIPWIASERSAASGRNNPIGWVRNYLARRTGCVAANSQTAATILSAQGFNNVTVIPNAVKLPEGKTHGSLPSKNPFQLLTIGRLTKTKNYVSLLEAVAILKEKNIPVILTIVGGGQDLPQLQKLTQLLDISNLVVFKGEQILVDAFYTKASGFISVSLLEGQPNTVLEAAGHKVPLILSDIPAHLESIGTAGALFCNGLNPNSIAAAIEASISERQSVTDVRVSTAYQVLASRDITTIASRYEELYAAAVENKF